MQANIKFYNDLSTYINEKYKEWEQTQYHIGQGYGGRKGWFRIAQATGYSSSAINGLGMYYNFTITHEFYNVPTYIMNFDLFATYNTSYFKQKYTIGAGPTIKKVRWVNKTNGSKIDCCIDIYIDMTGWSASDYDYYRFNLINYSANNNRSDGILYLKTSPQFISVDDTLPSGESLGIEPYIFNNSAEFTIHPRHVIAINEGYVTGIMYYYPIWHEPNIAANERFCQQLAVTNGLDPSNTGNYVFLFDYPSDGKYTPDRVLNKRFEALQWYAGSGGAFSPYQSTNYLQAKIVY